MVRIVPPHTNPNKGNNKITVGENRENFGKQHEASTPLLKLSLRTNNEKHCMCKSTVESPLSTPNITSITPRIAPVMSRMIQAQAQLGASGEEVDTGKMETNKSGQFDIKNGHNTLVIRLKEIFGFVKAEEVISGVFDDLLLRRG